MSTVSVKMEKSGRILIPAELRRRLGLAPGSEVLVRVTASGLQLSTREQALGRIHERLRKYIPKGRVLSREILEERREEAALENRS
jgi:AbrB family looped-hinge helix DNA binding protein